MTSQLNQLRKSQLVAHRGLPQRFPENSLPGLAAAVRAGAKWLEVDVQLTAELTPILYHDDNARRVSGHDRSVLTSSLAELQRFGAFCPDQFGAFFRGTPINTLRQLVRQLNHWPGVRTFVEIKPQSIRHFGPAVVCERLELDLAALVDRCSVAAIITKDHHILTSFREAGWPIGWVLPAWNAGNGAIAAQLQPDYLFVKQDRVPDDEAKVWLGRWDWVVYPVDDVHDALHWQDRGWPFIETNVLDVLNRTASVH